MTKYVVVEKELCTGKNRIIFETSNIAEAVFQQQDLEYSDAIGDQQYEYFIMTIDR